MYSSSIHRWLLVRVRLLSVVLFLCGSFLPPYVPKAALASQETAVVSQQFLLVEDGFIMKSSSLTRQGSRRAYAEGIVHTVKEGESLERLADRYKIKAETIRWANKMQEGGTIRPGDELVILPVDGILHAVTRGQTLSRIAALYDIGQQVIIDQNKLTSGFLIAGQELIIPGVKPIVGKPTVVAMADQPPPGIVLPPAIAAVTGEPEEVAQFTPTPTKGVLQKPCAADCFFTQYYHAGHFAVDMQDKGGGPVYSAEAGTVIRADMGWNGGYGNVIEIDHGNGLVTLYAHNKEHYVKVGDAVARGQTISWMGNTGRVYGDTGIHVHFEVHLRGVKKNPLLYLE